MPRRHPTLAPAAGAFAALALAACASGGTAPIEAANTTSPNMVRVETNQGTAAMQLTRNDAAVENALPGAPDRVFAVLPDVYAGLGLTVNTAVSAARTVGVSDARIRRVGREPMSRFLSCGVDATGSPLADTYAVTLTVLSRVTATNDLPNGSLLSTQVVANARPISVSGNSIPCQSTGQLEDRILKATLVRIAPR